MRKYYLYILFTVSFIANSVAQDIGDDLNKMNRAYENCETISMQVKYSVFFDGKTEPNETATGIIKKAKNKVYNEEFSSETLVNDNYLIMVDHQSKMVIVKDSDKSEKVSEFTKIDTDTLLKHFDKVEFKGTNESNLKLYHLSYKTGSASFVELWLNAKTGFLEKIKMHYREKMEVEDGKFSKVIALVEYNNIRSNMIFSKDMFSEKKYVNITNKEVLLTQKYKDYELINHLN